MANAGRFDIIYDPIVLALSGGGTVNCETHLLGLKWRAGAIRVYAEVKQQQQRCRRAGVRRRGNRISVLLRTVDR